MKSLIGSLVVLLLIGSCSTEDFFPKKQNKVTETGNPCAEPGPSCPSEPETPVETIYSNEVLRLNVTYPEGWTVAEEVGSDKTVVTFTSGRETEKSAARMELSRLAEKPSSLQEHLTANFSDLTVKEITFKSVSGYLHEEEIPGPNGGEQKTVFFLQDVVFVKVGAEIFPVEKALFQELMDGVEFY